MWLSSNLWLLLLIPCLLGRLAFWLYLRSPYEFRNGWEVVFFLVCGPWVWVETLILAVLKLLQKP